MGNRSHWQPQVAQELRWLLHERQECSVTELTEGSYAREGTVETGIVKLRTVELKVGEVNVVELLVGKGLAEREQNPGETNQVQNTVKESKVLEVNVNEEVVTLKCDVNNFYDLIDLVGEEVVDGTAIPEIFTGTAIPEIFTLHGRGTRCHLYRCNT